MDGKNAVYKAPKRRPMASAVKIPPTEKRPDQWYLGF